MQVNRKYIPMGVFVLLLLALGGWWVYGYYTTTDEDRIHASLERLREGAEKRSARQILNEIDDDYHDRLNESKEVLSNRVRYWVVRNLKKDVTLQFEEIRITFVGDPPQQAYVTFRIDGNEPVLRVRRWLHESGLVRVTYRKKGGSWLILNADKADPVPEKVDASPED